MVTGTNLGVLSLKIFPVVDLKGFDPAKAEETARQLREKILPDLQQQVTSALGWMESVKTKSREAQEILKAQIAKKQEEENTKAAQEGREPEVLHPRRWLDLYLEHLFEPYRRTAWLALLLYYLNTPKTKEQAQSWLTDLCKRGQLLEDETGTLTIFSKKYAVAAEANLGEPEMCQLRQAAANLETKVAQGEKLREYAQKDTILNEGTLSTKEFLEGKLGLLSVMPTDDAGKVNGALVVKSIEGKVYVHKAVGTFQPEMMELANAGTYLLLRTLTWDTLSPSFFTQKANFSQKEAQLLTRFWQLLKTGLARKERKERVQALREQFTAKASLTPKEYLLEGKAGTCFLEKEGRWDGPGPTTIYNLFFVVERMVNEAETHTRLVMRPPWTREFFANCPVDTWWPEGEKFGGLPLNLRLVLQSIYGQVEKHQKLEVLAQT